jgi:small subunit ribosomal protein S6
MRRYETVFIVDPDVSEDDRKQRFDKVIDLIATMKGAIIEMDDWGSKRLAYEIKKKNRGHYMRIDYCGTGELVAEMERTFRIDDKILKYMTIILQDNADPEKIKVELAETRAKKAAEEASRAEAAKNDEKKFASDDDDDDDDYDDETDDSREEEE